MGKLFIGQIAGLIFFVLFVVVWYKRKIVIQTFKNFYLSIIVWLNFIGEKVLFYSRYLLYLSPNDINNYFHFKIQEFILVFIRDGFFFIGESG